MNTESVLLPFRLRTVRTGVQATFLVLAGLVAYPFLPISGQVDTVPYLTLLAIAAAGVVVVALLPWRLLFERGIGMWFGEIVARFVILGVLTFMASFLFRELMRQMSSHGEAREESERRAALLATVAGAARGMSTLSYDRILSSVIDSVTALGFDAATLGVFEDDQRAYRVACAKGMPPAFVTASHPATHGTTAQLLRERKTIIVDDYGQGPSTNPHLREQGFTCGIITPVWVQAHIVAALAVLSRTERQFTPQEVEAVELLAAQAGRALENARLFEEEQHTVERLAELDRLKQDFLSTVSHELRTPLTAIHGMGITLEKRWAELGETRRADFLRRLNANAESLNELITTLLDFSRLEEGPVEVEVQPVHLDDLLKATASRLASLFTGDALTIDVDPDLIVEGDPHLLERVIVNLLSNAAKHTPEHTPVTLAGRAQDGYAVVSVIDDGGGIPPQELAHLGERFFRGGHVNTRETRGTGIGLAIARKAVTLHGADLEIESEVGRGSRFAFKLPLALRTEGALGQGTIGAPSGSHRTSPEGAPTN